MNAKSFHLSVQGASHIRRNKECQDASASFHDEAYAIAVVCDGHGGDDYIRSAIGAKLGCDAAEDNIGKFLQGVKPELFLAEPERHLNNLKASIINDWNEAIADYHRQHPFEEAELQVVSERARRKYVQEGRIESAYGTTMVAAGMCGGYWFGLHIGDGKCVTVNAEGEFEEPIPWDPKCFLNVTTSICDENAIEHFRHFYSDKLPAAVFVGSDGIDDCFQNKEQFYHLYKTVLYSFATTELAEASKGLEEYLPRLSAKGSGDDMSIAALLNFDILPELSIVRDYDREREKARVEENARKEAERNEAERRRVEEEHARFQRQYNGDPQRVEGVPAEYTRAEGVPAEYTQAEGVTAEYTQVEGGGGQNFCTECGVRLSPEAKYCSNCGMQVASVFCMRQGQGLTKSADTGEENRQTEGARVEGVPTVSIQAEDGQMGCAVQESPKPEKAEVVPEAETLYTGI